MSAIVRTRILNEIPQKKKGDIYPTLVMHVKVSVLIILDYY